MTVWSFARKEDNVSPVLESVLMEVVGAALCERAYETCLRLLDGIEHADEALRDEIVSTLRDRVSEVRELIASTDRVSLRFNLLYLSVSDAVTRKVAGL